MANTCNASLDTAAAERTSTLIHRISVVLGGMMSEQVPQCQESAKSAETLLIRVRNELLHRHRYRRDGVEYELRRNWDSYASACFYHVVVGSGEENGKSNSSSRRRRSRALFDVAGAVRSNLIKIAKLDEKRFDQVLKTVSEITLALTKKEKNSDQQQPEQVEDKKRISKSAANERGRKVSRAGKFQLMSDDATYSRGKTKRKREIEDNDALFKSVSTENHHSTVRIVGLQPHRHAVPRNYDDGRSVVIARGGEGKKPEAFENNKAKSIQKTPKSNIQRTENSFSAEYQRWKKRTLERAQKRCIKKNAVNDVEHTRP